MTPAQKLAVTIILRAIDSSQEYIIEQNIRRCPDCKSEPYCGRAYSDAKFVRMNDKWKPGLVMGPEWIRWTKLVESGNTVVTPPGSGAELYAPCPRCSGTAHVGPLGPIGQAMAILREGLDAP